jgi:cob(I)alamin adenosyltransferase
MKIYTKSGDQGQTSLWGGGRVAKSHPRVGAYGTVDEANSAIGLALSFVPANEHMIHERLTRVQNELFQLGSELATQVGAKNSCALVSEVEISKMENEIDEMESVLEPLKNFILPSGSSAGAALHLARTIVRRSERECVDLLHSESIRPEAIQYLNRLSDYLFVAARYVNHILKQPEIKWTAPKI